MATRTSLNLATQLAVRAVQTAICASWSASGTGVTAVSPITSTPSSPNWCIFVSIIIPPDTQVIPGAVFIICNAGRSTLLVVLRAPASCPSASPAFIITQPRYRGSFTSSRACSMVIPLFLRISARSCAYSSALGLLSGSIMVAFSMLLSPMSFASESISSRLPNRIMFAILSERARFAARRVRRSVPSGKTMRWRSCFAALIN